MKSFVLTLSATLLLVSVGYQQHKVPVLGHHVVSQLSRWTRYNTVLDKLRILCTKRPSIHHYMTSLTPVRYQAVLGSLPGPGSILDRIRAAAEPNASKIGSMPAAKLSNCRRKTLERGAASVCGPKPKRQGRRRGGSERGDRRPRAARLRASWLLIA